MYTDILVPTDGSEGTETVVAHAIEIATRFDASFHTVFVVDTAVSLDDSALGPLDALEESGRAAVDNVIEQATAADIETVEGSIARGAPYRGILAYVDEHDIDLIVMGTHGRSGLDRYLLGSVTEKVVRLADVPVLTIPIPPAVSE